MPSIVTSTSAFATSGTDTDTLSFLSAPTWTMSRHGALTEMLLVQLLSAPSSRFFALTSSDPGCQNTAATTATKGTPAADVPKASVSSTAWQTLSLRSTVMLRPVVSAAKACVVAGDAPGRMA